MGRVSVGLGPGFRHILRFHSTGEPRTFEAKPEIKTPTKSDICCQIKPRHQIGIEPIQDKSHKSPESTKSPMPDSSRNIYSKLQRWISKLGSPLKTLMNLALTSSNRKEINSKLEILLNSASKSVRNSKAN